MNDIIFKTLLLKGEAGNNIIDIKKTSTNGLVDTYTITRTDGVTTTFKVTNGKSITDIKKTGSTGLVDTYTITYNDGTMSTFTVTNGKDGSITDEILFNNMNSLCVFQIYDAGVFRELGGNAPTTYGNVICIGKRRPWNGRSYGDGYFLYVSSNTELYVGMCVNDEATITWKELTNNPITNSDIDIILNS